jgi:hypothetical protein
VSDRDLLLERLLSGEADALDRDVQELFARDPSARVEFEALQALERSLERQGDRAREVVETSRQLGDEAGSRHVREVLGDLAAHRPAPVRALLRRRDRVALALAAAVLLAIAWGVWSRRAEPEPEIAMGPEATDALVLLRPRGVVDGYAPFEWTGRLDPGGWFQVSIYDPSAPLGSEPLFRSGSLRDNQWTPESAQALWPATIQWTVSSFDVSGRGTTSELVTASRRH